MLSCVIHVTLCIIIIYLVLLPVLVWMAVLSEMTLGPQC